MMNNNFSGLLGLCRKACKMAIGHDAVIASIKQGKSKLAVTCRDASPRLKKEILDECNFNNRNIKYVDAPFTMSELGLAIGKKAGETLEFGGLLGSGPIMKVNLTKSPKKFIDRAGRIPAPLQSLKN